MTARTTPEWLDRMRGARVLDMAHELGKPTAPARGASGGSVYGCPACGAERRHSKTSDKRGAVGIRVDGLGWRCFQCDASGDALDFVAMALRGSKLAELGDAGRQDVREWCQRWLGLDVGSSSASPRPKPLARPVAPPAPSPRPEPTYPPLNEVTALWGSCVRVDSVPEVRAWLEAKRIDPTAVADMDLARAIPASARLPSWAAFRGMGWHQAGYRIVVPLVDAHGAVRSIRARHVFGGAPKSLAPSGYQAVGLVFACPLARQVLSSGALPEWWPEGTPLRIEVAEGEKKWLMRATLAGDAHELAPACIAVESGAWTAEHAARIPDGAEVFVASDPDEAGARYATVIVQSFAERIRSGAVRVELRAEHELHAANGQLEVRVRS